MAVASSKNIKIKQKTIFVWQGVNKRGNKINGEITGDSLLQVKAQLRTQGITPSKVRKKPVPLFNFKKAKIKAADISMLTRQIATMLGAGVPLLQTIEMIEKGTENDKLRELLGQLGGQVQSGLPFSEALRQHPRYFDELYCDLVKSGEHSGSLEQIFDRIATYKEKAEYLKSKIKKAMFYPVAVVAIAIIVTAILLIFVVPQFEAIFSSFGAELPFFTQIVIGISRWLQTSWYYLIAIIAAAGYGIKEFHFRSEAFRNWLDNRVLGLPVIGDILRKAAVARYARTLSTTFAAGVPLIDALESAAGASGNSVFRDAILSIRADVSTGMQMNLSMRATGIFPDMVTQMVQIGEESGAVDDMLSKVATIYEQQVDDAVDGLSSLLEPMIMAVLGVVIGGLIVAMYLPIFQIGNVVK